MSQQKNLLPMRVGERLKHRRLELKQKLGEVAETLHIDERVMRGIESDEATHMAPLYRRGYIRRYAQHLGFDATEIQEMLDEVGNEQPELHTVFPEAGNPRQAERWIKATSYVLASLLVGTLAWQFTYEAVRISQERGNAEVSLGERVQSSQGAETTDPVKGSGHVNASIAALEKLSRQRPQAGSGNGAQAWSAIQGVAAEAGDGSVLELSASGDSWVEITDANGAQLEMDLVRGGSSKQYRGEAPFNIQLGRASAVSLSQDGRPVDIASFTNGDVAQLKLNGDGSAEAAGPVKQPGG